MIQYQRNNSHSRVADQIRANNKVQSRNAVPIQMQYTVGRSSVHNTPVIQNKLKKWKPSTAPKNKVEEQGQEAAVKVSDEVDKAHEELEQNNLQGANEPFQKLYLNRLNEFRKGNKTMHPSTAAGYVIESKVTNRLQGFDGFNFQETGLLKGTRPDVVVSLTDKHVALVDITAQKSLGHIFTKKGNWTEHKKIPYVAEAWYPSLSFKDKAEKLTDEQIKEAELVAEQRKEMAEWMRLERIKMKQEKFFSGQKEVWDALLNVAPSALEYLLNKPRDIAVIRGVGVDIGDDGKTVSRLSFEQRNHYVGGFLTHFESDDENPVPGFKESDVTKAIRVIMLAHNLKKDSDIVWMNRKREERRRKRDRQRKK